MDQLVEDLLFLEVIIQKNELNPAPPWPRVRLRWIQAGAGSFGSSLLCSLGDFGCVCAFSALHISSDKLCSHLAVLGMGVCACSCCGRGSAGVGRSRQAGGSWCDHTGAQGAPPAHGEQWGWSIPPALVLENDFALFFQGRTHHSASAQVVSHSNSFYFREAVTFMNFCG